MFLPESKWNERKKKKHFKISTVIVKMNSVTNIGVQIKLLKIQVAERIRSNIVACKNHILIFLCNQKIPEATESQFDNKIQFYHSKSGAWIPQKSLIVNVLKKIQFKTKFIFLDYFKTLLETRYEFNIYEKVIWLKDKINSWNFLFKLE